MIVSIKGVRGSIPTSSPETSYFGGNTACFTVFEDNCMLILDGGSGLQKVTLPDHSIERVDILITHLHFDHIQGLGFFNPLFDASKKVHIWAPVSSSQDLQSRLSRFLSPPLFPVLMRDLPSQLSLHDISNSRFEIGPFQIDSRYVIHPGPTVGFRVKGKNSVVAYIPDHEPALGPAGIIMDKKWISGFDLVDNADLMIHDAQFTTEEYKSKIGWGHSSMEDTLKLATIAGVKKLLFTHHDPSRTDAQLQEIMVGLRETHPEAMDFEFAREGMEIELG